MFLVSDRQCRLGPRKSPTNVKLNFETDWQDERCVNKMATQSKPTSMSILMPSLVRNSIFYIVRNLKEFIILGGVLLENVSNWQ